MSDYKEMERIAGKHGYYIIYQKKGGVFSSTEYVVKKPDGSYSGTFSGLDKAVDYVNEKIGR